jgi:hypothetical protein
MAAMKKRFPIQLTLGELTPGPKRGWCFRVGGGIGSMFGQWLLQEDDEGHAWLEWFGKCTGIRMFVPPTIFDAIAEARAAKSRVASSSDDYTWHAVGDGALAPPFGTIRVCRGCDCLVAGGPTACRRCAEE